MAKYIHCYNRLTMCCRYSVVASSFKTWGIQENIPGFSDNYNAAPGARLPVLIKQSPLHVELMRWGLIPHWSKTASIKFSTVNARAETIVTSPTYRDAFLRHRCLVPCNGFYEWRKNEDGTKTPFFIHLINQTNFAFAGIWDVWRDAEGKELKSYSIATAPSNELMTPIHNRMPVILSKEAEDQWLDTSTPQSKALSLLVPFDSSQMEAYEVSDQVNSVKNNTPELIKRI